MALDIPSPQMLSQRRRSISQPNLLANLQIPEANHEDDLNDPHLMAAWNQDDIANLIRSPDLLTVPGAPGQRRTISRSPSIVSNRSRFLGEDLNGGHGGGGGGGLRAPGGVARSISGGSTYQARVRRMSQLQRRPSEANLQDYLEDAQDIADDILGTSANIRKISVIQKPATPNAQNNRGGSHHIPGSSLFHSSNKKKGKEQQASMLISFAEEDPLEENDVSSLNSLDMETEASPSSSSQLPQQQRQQQQQQVSRFTFGGESQEGSGSTADIGAGSPIDASNRRLRKQMSIVRPEFVVGDEDSSNANTPKAEDTGLADKRSLKREASIANFTSMTRKSEETSEEMQIQEERKVIKKQRTWDYLTMVLSMIYAVGFLILGIVLYLVDLFTTKDSQVEIGPCFNIYLMVVGMAWMIFLVADISYFGSKLKKYHKKHSFDPSKFELVQGEDGELMLKIPLLEDEGPMPQYYCFARGRHSGSMFLKIGAAAFAIGHLVNVGLQLGKHIVYFLEGDVGNIQELLSFDCAHVETLLSTCIAPIYIAMQLYLTFKYSNVIVNRHKILARFGLMHQIMSSLCIWVYAIVRETMDGIVDKKFFAPHSKCFGDGYYGATNDSHASEHNHWLKETPEHTTQYPSNYSFNENMVTCYEGSAVHCFQDSGFHVNYNMSCVYAQICACAIDNEVALYIFNLGPYLYPFSIEFSILVVAVWYIMWSNIGKVEENRHDIQFMPAVDDDDTPNPLNNSLYIYADCQAAMKGIFVGLTFIVATIIGIIVFFILSGSDDCEDQKTGLMVNEIYECILLSVMILTTLWVYRQISKLEVNPHPISFLDDLLLFVCIPSFFLYALINIMPVFQDIDLLPTVFTNVLMLVQVIIQTPMIVDGLRRCSDSTKNQRSKPGRNMLTFLLVANLGIYFWDTMEVKDTVSQTLWKQFYGEELYTLLSHVTLPLCIFYRFHASVALADIWSSAYQPGDHH